MNNFRPPESYLPDTEQTLVLVDYSNLLYRSWFVSNQQKWVAYCKFFDMLRLCVKRSKQENVPIKVIFAGESQVILKRKEFDPDYKGDRKPVLDPKFNEFRNGLVDLLGVIGWELICVDGAEADDVIASIVSIHCHRCKCTFPCECDTADKYKTDIVIFSGDRDIQQCLAWDRTFVYRAPGIFVSKETFFEEHGFPVEKYNVYKALVGDKSDNIKGVEGFGPAKATIAIKADTVAEDVWEMHGEGGTDQFRHALALVNLDYKLDIDIDAVYIGPPLISDNKLLNKNEKVLLEVQRLKEEF